MRKATSLTISSDILNEIALTKGTASTSERVNNLLKRALESERRERIEREAAEFFATENAASVRERAAFRKAAKRVLSRD
jgi:hypothetical protein